METPDFYAVIAEQPDKTVGFHKGLLDLFDHMLNDAGIEDENIKQNLVRARSRIDIELKNL